MDRKEILERALRMPAPTPDDIIGAYNLIMADSVEPVPVLDFGPLDLDARADAGATLLDEARSDWLSRVEPGDLNMYDPRWCVLGQVYGGYHEASLKLARQLEPGKFTRTPVSSRDIGREALHRLERDLALDADQVMARYGFYIDFDAIGALPGFDAHHDTEHYEAAYEQLTAVWRTIILDRREAAGARA